MAKDKQTEPAPEFLKWTGAKNYIPGYFELTPGRTYRAADLPASAHEHPYFKPATAKQYQAQAEADAKAEAKSQEVNDGQ